MSVAQGKKLRGTKTGLHKKLRPVAAALLGVLLLGGTAHADGNKPVNEEAYAFEGITVTAQKKEENVQKVPMSIGVLPAAEIEEAGIKSTKALQGYVPNVFFKDNGSTLQPTIRGVGSSVIALHSPMALYVDDINIPLVYSLDQELFDVERVEVLKGPQGTLYGRNSEAGAINIITRQPDNELRGKIIGESTLYDTNHGTSPGYSLGGSVSGPLVQDTLYLGLSGRWTYDQGPTKNDYTSSYDAMDMRRVNGRAHLRWTPNERLDISLLADVFNSYDNFGNGHYIDGPYKTDHNNINRDHLGADDTRHWRGNSQSLRVKYEGDDVDFLSITGHRYFGDDAEYDQDATTIFPSFLPMGPGMPPLPVQADYNMFQKEDDTMWSQEFRLSSSKNSTSPFSWLLGAYGFTEQLSVSADSLMPISGMMGPMPFKANMDERFATDINISGVAVFGQGTYTLFDRLHLTAGLRYEYTEQYGEHNYATEFAMPGMAMASHMEYSKRLVSSELLPKFSVSYDITDDVMAYATVSKGYMTGGFDYSARSGEALAYDPEYTWNYEVGLKSSWLDNRIIANISAFYIQMYDKQVAESFGPNMVRISNAGEAASRGFEVELRVRPVTGLEVYGGFGYTDTRFTKWYDSMDAFDYEGNQVPDVPQFTYNVGAMYQHDSGLYGRVDVLGTGEYYHDPKNQLKEPGYELVNLRLGYVYENVDVALWCNNVFDRRYQTKRMSVPAMGGYTLAFDGDPRQFGLTVSYSF